MKQNIATYAKERYTAKAYDASKKISAEDILKIKDLLRFSPSSTNSQPWHFILASTEEGKAKIAKSTAEKYPFNHDAIINASHVVVFCRKTDLDETHLRKVLEQEDQDGRFALDPTFKERQHATRSLFANMHIQDLKDGDHWMEKQVYLNIGQFLLGVATLGIDATPMEGIDTEILDQELNLQAQGDTSVVVVTLGYSDPEGDFNAKLPKSRLPFYEILTEI